MSFDDFIFLAFVAVPLFVCFLAFCCEVVIRCVRGYVQTRYSSDDENTANSKVSR